jgi:hypothetical protein
VVNASPIIASTEIMPSSPTKTLGRRYAIAVDGTKNDRYFESEDTLKLEEPVKGLLKEAPYSQNQD